MDIKYITNRIARMLCNACNLIGAKPVIILPLIFARYGIKFLYPDKIR
jgi:hypothetical protein